jgi:tetratricopeptide (TPR) repeat protein
LTGLFGGASKDPNLKTNVKKFKEFKKLLHAKKYDESLKAGLSLLKTAPNHHDALFMVGSIYYLKNKHRIAVSYFDKSLGIGEYDVDVLLLKAYSHQKLGENKRVISCCEKILEIDPKNKPVDELLQELGV